MARDAWDPASPEGIGLQFQGVGLTGHVIFSNENWRAIRFNAQRSGEVDEIGIYSGAFTVMVPLSGIFAGKLPPYIIDLYPVSGFSYDEPHTITTYTSDIIAAANAVNQSLGALVGDELASPNDGKFAIQANGVANIRVDMPGANTFGLNRHVLSVAIEHSASRQMQYERVDEGGPNNFIWRKVLPAGLRNAHIGEAFIDFNDPGTWHLWTPNDVREFSNLAGTRQLRVRSLSGSGNPTIDLLRIHVDSILERRAGVGVIDVTTNPVNEWVSVPMHLPNVTGSPMTVEEGGEYILLIRTAAADADYGTLTRFDTRALSDVVAPGGGFTHFEGLDWTYHEVEIVSGAVQSGLGPVVDGLPCVTLLNNGAQTVDSQPYERSVGARVHAQAGNFGTINETLIGSPDPTVLFRECRFVASDALSPEQPLRVRVRAAVGGPQLSSVEEVSVEDFAASQLVGPDEFGHNYRLIRVQFDAAFVVTGSAEIEFSSDTPQTNPWLVAALVTDASGTAFGTSEQDYDSSSGLANANGVRALNPITGSLSTSFGADDLEAAIFSQPPTITGVGVEVLQQSVTGGTCEPCGPQQPLGCTVLSIPYAQVCWSESTLLLDDFQHYEVQRSEGGGPFETVDVIAPTGTGVQPVEGDADFTAAQTTAHVAPSVEADTAAELLICAWQSFGGTNYTVPGSMTLDVETDGSGGVDTSTMVTATEAINAVGPTGTRTATSTASLAYSAVSVLAEGEGGVPVIEEALNGVSSPGAENAQPIDLTTTSNPQVGWWLIAIQGWSFDGLNPPGGMRAPSGDDWIRLADSGFTQSSSRTIAWAKRVTEPGDVTVTFFTVQGLTATNHARLFVLSDVASVTVSGSGEVPNCYDDWSAPFGVESCYRVRQRRADGADSDWSDTVCITVEAADSGADLIITAPEDPDLNVAFPESHSGRLPVERDWTLLDATQRTHRAIYGRDNQLSFRPVEKLGVRFARRLLVSTLCTPVTPCLDVVQGLRDISTAQTPYLVVRDQCGNRWYASVDIPNVVQLVDPGLPDDIWFADVEVTELITPVIDPDMT